MNNTPVDAEIVQLKKKECGIESVGKASIREMVKLVSEIEAASGVRFIRMEMGVPGLESSRIGIDAEIAALERGVTSVYPPMDGIPELKNESARFLKLFTDAGFSPAACIPTVGSMQASMAAIMVANRRKSGQNKTLFIDPGFPVQKLQVKSLGLNFETFDIYSFRGDLLREKLESYLSKGDISCIIYSNPNNPSWVCLTDHELKIIGELADKYDVIIIEDLAYFAMDFRSPIGTPGVAPYQPTVRKYTENCILLVSGSKVFSYAGQRIGVMAVTDKLFYGTYPDMVPYFGTSDFGHSIIYGALYGLSAGACHTAQHALAALFKAASDGRFKFVEDIKEYEKRARLMKQTFVDNGFYIVYDKDEDQPLGDGFYFTVNYPGFTGAELLEELLYYGISAVTLDITGSTKEGLRACVSRFHTDETVELGWRLKLFKEHHP